MTLKLSVQKVDTFIYIIYKKKTESLTSAANLISHLNAQFKCIHGAIQTLAATS